MHFNFSKKPKVLSGQVEEVREPWERGKWQKREIKSHISNFLEFSSLIPSACLILRTNFLHRYQVPSRRKGVSLRRNTLQSEQSEDLHVGPGCLGVFALKLRLLLEVIKC